MTISISFDSGESLSILQALRDPAMAQRVANAAAESYVDDTLDWIAEGHSFISREGHLEQSIGWRPLSGGVAEIYANAEYAAWVEEGTRPHVILPKAGRKGLKIPVSGGGGYILRRKVNHPGSAAKPFFFADQPGRAERMKERGLSVLAGVIRDA